MTSGIRSLSLRVILDNLSNQLLARCLVVQSRLHFGKDIEYESNINRLSLEWQRCSDMKPKRIVHYRDTIGLAGKLLLGDKELISRVEDLDFIKG